MPVNEIHHLVVLMMENRSFDHVFGSLRLNGRDDVNGIPTPRMSNPGPAGPIEQWPMDDTPCSYNVPHLQADVAAQYDNGKMDGFVSDFHNRQPDADPRIPMGYYTAKTFPVLYALADKFTICDAWFASVLSSTWPNRKYFHSGTRDQDDDTQLLPGFPGFGTIPLYRALEETDDPQRLGHKLTWRCYFSDLPFLAFWYGFAATHLQNFSSVLQFALDCASGALPHVSIVDPPFTLADDHPPHDPKLGEKFIGLVVDALTTSKSWDDTALLILFDEHGGFYDHVKPLNPDIENKWKDAPYGFRVPALIVSPFTGNTQCVHTTFDHTSFISSIHDQWKVQFPSVPYDVRWTKANTIWGAFNTATRVDRGIYTGVKPDDTIGSLNWAAGIYDRLKDDVQRFEHLLDRIFVLPELKPLDQRASVFDTLGAFEHQVITQKRMIGATSGAAANLS